MFVPKFVDRNEFYQTVYSNSALSRLTDHTACKVTLAVLALFALGGAVACGVIGGARVPFVVGMSLCIGTSTGIAAFLISREYLLFRQAHAYIKRIKSGLEAYEKITTPVCRNWGSIFGCIDPLTDILDDGNYSMSCKDAHEADIVSIRFYIYDVIDKFSVGACAQAKTIFERWVNIRKILLDVCDGRRLPQELMLPHLMMLCRERMLELPTLMSYYLAVTPPSFAYNVCFVKWMRHYQLLRWAPQGAARLSESEQALKEKDPYMRGPFDQLIKRFSPSLGDEDRRAVEDLLGVLLDAMTADEKVWGKRVYKKLQAQYPDVSERPLIVSLILDKLAIPFGKEEGGTASTSQEGSCAGVQRGAIPSVVTVPSASASMSHIRVLDDDVCDCIRSFLDIRAQRYCIQAFLWRPWLLGQLESIDSTEGPWEEQVGRRWLSAITTDLQSIAPEACFQANDLESVLIAPCGKQCSTVIAHPTLFLSRVGNELIQRLVQNNRNVSPSGIFYQAMMPYVRMEVRSALYPHPEAREERPLEAPLLLSYGWFLACLDRPYGAPYMLRTGRSCNTPLLKWYVVHGVRLDEQEGFDYVNQILQFCRETVFLNPSTFFEGLHQMSLAGSVFHHALFHMQGGPGEADTPYRVLRAINDLLNSNPLDKEEEFFAFAMLWEMERLFICLNGWLEEAGLLDNFMVVHPRSAIVAVRDMAQAIFHKILKQRAYGGGIYALGVKPAPLRRAILTLPESPLFGEEGAHAVVRATFTLPEELIPFFVPAQDP